MDNNEILNKDATELVADCYTELSKYVIKTRGYASVVDGMKAVYRRTVYASRIYKDRIKSVAIIGDTIKLHPHGDDSIKGVLNTMTCKYYEFPLFDGKGNFGGLGGDAASPRYTEACLSEIGRLMYLELIDYAEFIDGEAGFKEPRYLPALIPYCLLAGSSGLTVGMPTPNIPPLNALEVIDYWIARLENKPARIPMPDLGEIILNCSREETIEPLIMNGTGKLWFRGLIIQEDDNKFVVCTSTPNCYVGDLASKLSWYIDEGYVDYNDESDREGYRHVFVVDKSKMNPEEFKEKLERKMKCSMSYRIILEEDEKAVYCGIDYIWKKNIKYLRECTVRKFTDLSNKVEEKVQVLRAIRDFKNAGYVKQLDSMAEDDVIEIVHLELGYDEWVGKSLLDKPTKYMTKSHDEEIVNLEKELEQYKFYKNNPDKYLLTLYYKLRDMVLPFYNSRGHSLLRDEMNSSEQYYAKLNKDDKKVIVSEDNSGIKWNRNLLLVTDNGKIYRRYISSRISAEIELDSDENYIDILTDNSKYIVLVAGRYLTVKRTNEISDSKSYIKLWDGYSITKCYATKNDKLIVFDEKGNYDQLNLENWIKGRISYPSRCMKYDIVEFKEVE